MRSPSVAQREFMMTDYRFDIHMGVFKQNQKALDYYLAVVAQPLA